VTPANEEEFFRRTCQKAADLAAAGKLVEGLRELEWIVWCAEDADRLGLPDYSELAKKCRAARDAYCETYGVPMGDPL